MIGSLHPMQLRKLLSFDCVNEVEDECLDEGRFFIHLEKGYSWDSRQFDPQRTKSFDNYRKAVSELRKIK